MSERLQKFLAKAGVASRRASEQLILDGRVTVNKVVVREMGTQVDASSDVVAVDGKVVGAAETLVVYLFHKPVDVLSTLKDPQGRVTIADFIKGLGQRVYPIGRLDYDAEGALLLTNDGDLANQLTHPKFQVPRHYLAKVKGHPNTLAFEKLRSGVRLEDGMAQAATAELFSVAEANTWIHLMVTEGRNHLIKRMCAAVGHPVVRLFRPSHGGLSIKDLPVGGLRQLATSEVDAVRLRGLKDDLAVNCELFLPDRRHRPTMR